MPGTLLTARAHYRVCKTGAMAAGQQRSPDLRNYRTTVTPSLDKAGAWEGVAPATDHALKSFRSRYVLRSWSNAAAVLPAGSENAILKAWSSASTPQLISSNCDTAF